MSLKLPNKIQNWLSQRLPVETAEQFIDEQTHKPMPETTGFLHTFGSLSLFLFINQVVTGILLMVYYRPTTGTAF